MLSKKMIGIAAAAVATTGAVVAYAAITAGGGGTGSASAVGAATLQPLVFDASLPTGTLLSPDGMAQDLEVKVQNLNTYPVSFKKATIAVTGITGAAAPAGCTAAQFDTVEIDGEGAATSVTVPAGGPAATLTLLPTTAYDGGTVAWDVNDATNDCFGAVLTFTVTVDNS